MGHTFAVFQSDGTWPESIDFWKMSCSIGAIVGASCLRTLGCSSSGPIALWIFRSLSSFSTPSTDIWMSLISGMCRFFCQGLRLGKSDGLSVENTELNCLLRISALS